MPQQPLYPSLSTIVSADKLPAPIAQMVSNLTDKLFYKTFYFEKSLYGDVGFYRIVLVFKSDLGFNLFGDNEGEDGFQILFNPSSTSGLSELDLSLSYNLPILRYTSKSRIQSLESAQDFFQLFQEVLQLTDEILLYEAIQQFHGSEENPVESFVTIFNEDPNYGIDPLTIPTGDEFYENTQDIYNQFISKDISIPLYLFETYIFSENIEESIDSLSLLFENRLGNFSFDTLLDLLVPKFSAAANDLQIALAFPRKWLVPLDNNGNVIEGNVRSMLSYNVGTLKFGTEEGLDFDNANSFQLDKSQIANTGLTIEVTNLKLDFREDSNIPEADEDGRPSSFKGVFIESAVIGLPKEWVQNTATPITLTGTNLLIGSEGGVSGTITLDANNQIGVNLLGIELTLDTFSLTLSKNEVSQSNISGKMTIEGLKDTAGNTAELTVNVEWKIDGYNIIVEEPDGIALNVLDKITITLNKLIISNIEGNWSIDCRGKIEHMFDTSLIGKVLPKSIEVNEFDYANNEFDITFNWENNVTANISSENGLEMVIPVNRKFLDIFTIQLLKITANKDNDTLKIESTINAAIELGPVLGSMADGGITATIAMPDEGTNLGPFKVDIEFITPTGIGIGINTDFITGGGYLTYDTENGIYAGAVEIKLFDIQFTAVGLLNTKLPDGQPGFSLIIMITGTFSPPIQLGYGFTLNGIGGLVGYNRTVNTEWLRNSIIDNSISNILFPTEIAKNGAQIINSISQAFPIQRKRFIIGPIGKIGWGTPNIIIGDVALIVELPSPISVVLLGVVKSVLPNENKPMLKLQVNFVGILDFGKKQLSFDAFIYNSSFLFFTLTGSIALRLFWGKNPNFLYSAGGFHPQYSPPPMNLLPMDRIGMQLSSSNATLQLGAYFAITSNSLQFGAAVYAKAWISKFTIEGGAGFDALFIFKPQFELYASMWANLSVSAYNKTLFSISAQINLSGPNPWQANGSAKFEVLWMSYTVSFQITLRNDNVPEVKQMSIGSLIHDYLGDNNNWSAILPDNSALSVSIAEIDTGNNLVLHPYGRLRFMQKALPLNTTISKFGNTVINDYSLVLFEAQQNSSISYINNEFPRGEFYFLNVNERLDAANAFAWLPAGIDIGSASSVNIPVLIRKQIIYTQIIITADARSQDTGVITNPTLLDHHLAAGAIIQSTRSVRNNSVPTNGPEVIREEPQGFIVVNRNNLTFASANTVFENAMDARQYQNELVKSNPALRNNTMILHTTETN